MMFRYDPRLGIELPDFPVPFEEMSEEQQEDILVQWESIRARIPEQILKFERVIEELLETIHHEEDWDVIAAHFADISDYASRINELNTWRRVDPSLHPAHAEPSRSHEHRDREK
ncbi:MAG: hypothetical protein K6T30_10395 [Alicyclobacillus sp.]|nr:hypothetical protein [Alicyclobacillus sp.]